MIKVIESVGEAKRVIEFDNYEDFKRYEDGVNIGKGVKVAKSEGSLGFSVGGDFYSDEHDE